MKKLFSVLLTGLLLCAFSVVVGNVRKIVPCNKNQNQNISMTKIISDEAIKTREYWIGEIQKLSGHFVNDTERLVKELDEEIKKLGTSTIIDHLRLCGNIPECYKHDSSEEKLYSKYTDSLLSFAYQAIGLKSIVITERADVADVEGFGKDFSFVADAKTFRLSRTAKNQKDFKVQAMDRWKHGKPYAMVVCPIYQMPGRSSQIYVQASTRDVCLFIYLFTSFVISEICPRRRTINRRRTSV